MSNATRKLARANGNGKQEAAPTPPEVVDGAEFWRLQAQGNALEARRQEARAAQAEIRQLEREHQEAVRAMHAKYHLGEGDSINPETLAITRGARPPEEENAVGEALALADKALDLAEKTS